MVLAEKPAPDISKTMPARRNGNRPDLKTTLQKEIRPEVALFEPTETVDRIGLPSTEAAFFEANPQDVLNFPVAIWERTPEEIQDHFAIDGNFGESDGSTAENGKTKIPAISSEIVNRAGTGDEEALTEIYQALFPRVYRYLLSRVGDVDLAEDLAQDVFAKSLSAISNYEERGVPFAAWVFKIAHNQLINYKRHTHRSAQIKESMRDGFDMEDVDRRLDNIGSFKRVAEVLPLLSELQRQVILLRFIKGLSVTEVADALGKSENNIKAKQSQALGKMRILLGVPSKTGYPDRRYL